MTVTAKDAMELRKQTGVGLMTCRKALEEANGDKEKAIDILRKKGEAKAASKAERDMSEGQVGLHETGMVLLLCETDFVAQNDKFQLLVQTLAEKAHTEGESATKEYFESIKGEKIQEIGENMALESVIKLEGETLGTYRHTNGKIGCIVVLEGGNEDQARDIAMHAAAMNPMVANPEDVPADIIEKEKDVYREQLKNEGKPENIIENIIAGKVNKFCAERALASQPFVKDPSMTVAQYIAPAKIKTFARVAV